MSVVHGLEPDWWYAPEPQWQARLLSPVGTLVGKIAMARLRRGKAYRSRLPVICVGNFTAGGSGKTPLAIMLAGLVSSLNREPWFLSRGYGGTLKGPVRVECGVHSAHDVGDEPLLLARHAPTIIARDRRKAAEAIETKAPSNGVIIMDDGLQNPSLAKDLTIALVDAQRGFGNGRVIPAGPLRAPHAAQIELADLIILTGRDTGDAALLNTLRGMTRVPILKAQTRAKHGSGAFQGRRIVAYAGIANPQRFFSTLDSLGADTIARTAFPDHHAFSEEEAKALLDAAARNGADLVTTEKDLARLSGATSGSRAELRQRSTALAIETVIEGEGLSILTGMIERAVGA